jgi:photosystem II stability/assembly factor-like uncharacterized protein
MTRFERVVQILDAAVGGPAAGVGFPHGPFWRGVTRDQLVAKKIKGLDLLVVGNGAASNLVKALKGEAPFGVDLPTPPAGAIYDRMPAGLAPVPDPDIAFIQTWIDQGCLEDRYVPATSRSALAPALHWQATNAPVASSRTDDIWFTDPNTGWAVNSNGQVVHTTDGGDTWVEQLHDPAVYFRCIGFASPLRGWCGTVTAHKLLYETRDGGSTWTIVANLPPLAPSAVCGLSVVNDKVVYLAGTNFPNRPPRMIKTTDGGATWQAWDMRPWASILIDTFFTSPNRGWVVGGKTDEPIATRDNVQAVVLFTEDGGKTWVNRAASIQAQLPKGEWGWKIQFLNGRVGFVSLENFKAGAILKTVDGGMTWSRIPITDPQQNANLEGVGFVDENHGWVGGWGDADFQRLSTSETTDGGRTWRDANEVGKALNRFRFFGNPVMVGYASGQTVYKYTAAPSAVAAAGPAPRSGVKLLYQNQPARIAGKLELPIKVPASTRQLSVRVWDRFADHVATVIDETNPKAGPRIVEWESGQKAPGYFFVRVSADGTSEDQLIYMEPSVPGRKKKGLLSQLRWVKPGTPPQGTAAFALPPQPLEATSTGRALELYGIPEVPFPHNLTPLSEARYLLKAAAEIEHGLLVQYLYAQYSINPAAPGATDWATTIMNIAVQEMDHLVNVQNMLLALKYDSFRTYFDRANFPIPPEDVRYYPYSFRLEPITSDSLSKYVSAESPLPELVSDPVLRAKIEQAIAHAESVTDMKTFGHVGNLYAYLYWLFLPSDTVPDGPWPKFPGDWFRCHLPGHHLKADDFADGGELDIRQAAADEFRANDGNAPNYPNNDQYMTHRWIFRVKTADDAQRTIAQIAIQGEGTEMAKDSHFLEFLSIYESVGQLPNGTSSHLNVPTNPNLGDDPFTAGGRIVNKETELWARLCNTRYLILLQKLPLILSLRKDNGPEMMKRNGLVTSAFVEMLNGIRYLATRLMTLPRADGSNDFAGPIFELPGDLPSTTEGQWRELVRLIGNSGQLFTEIGGLTGTGQPNATDKIKFNLLQQSDKAILSSVPAEFQPPTTNGSTTMTTPQLYSFADVQAFFNNFIQSNGTDVSGAPHKDFWNMDYGSFVNGDVPGVPGVKILVPGNANDSNLIKILRGPLTVNGGTYPQMPADGSPFMAPNLIDALADWINRNCPNPTAPPAGAPSAATARASYSKQPGAAHGTRLFRGLDQFGGLPVAQGPMVKDGSRFGAQPAQLMIAAAPPRLAEAAPPVGPGGPLQPGRFGRIFARSNYSPPPAAIHNLAESMREPNTPDGDNPNVPLGLTFLGQFIDHDLTLDATTLFGQTQDPMAITDFRTPNLDLDNLYGAGPGVSRHMYDVTPPADKNPYKLILDFGRGFDLPRNSQNSALIGDLRNDENFLISQLHLAFIKFHNAVVDIVFAKNPAAYQGEHGNMFLFRDASTQVRWHFQWIIVHEFLPKVVGQYLVNDILTNGFRVFDWQKLGAQYPFMPVEFSTACYRLGHTMLRQDYVINDLIKKDLFDLPVFGSPRINSVLEKIDFTKFFDFPNSPPAQRARKFDAKITVPVFSLPFIDPVQDPPSSLPERNMLRGLVFGVPSGQEVAKAMGLRVYTNKELGISDSLSKDLGGQAPLFYYMLKESEFAPSYSIHLGPVGGRIVAEVILNFLKTIAGNYLCDDPTWAPTLPGAELGDFTMVDLLTIAKA